MRLFLIIVAGMFVGFLAIVLAIYLFVKFYMRSLLKQFADVAGAATKGIVPFMQPLRIKLEREPDPPWNDKAAVAGLVRPLVAAGFEEIGTFVMSETPDFCIHGLVQPAESVYAVIYDHPDMGVWFEVVSRYADGGTLTFTTNKPTGLDRPPNKLLERFESGTDPADLYQQHLARRPREDLLPASAQAFAGDFERAYAEEMDWRFARGGFTEAEIRNNLKRLDVEPDEQQVKYVHVMQQMQVSQWLHVKLKEGFRATANVSAAKWERFEERLIFVHDRLTSDEVHGVFTSCLDWDDEEAAEQQSDAAQKLAQAGPAREAFVRMLQVLPPDRPLKKIGHLTEPVAADVYLGPEGMDNQYD